MVLGEALHATPTALRGSSPMGGLAYAVFGAGFKLSWVCVTLSPLLPCRPDVLPWLTLRVTPFVCIVDRDKESPVSPPWEEPWFTCTALVQCILTLRKRLVKVRAHASDP